MNPLTLPKALQGGVDARLRDWRAKDNTRRLWARDASLWSGADEAKWLGWLDAPTMQRGVLDGLAKLARELGSEGVRDVAVLGMGGSSLCPFVLASTFGARLHVLDSTDPGQIRNFDKGLDPGRTAFVVSSKSGSTLEPNILRDYFVDRVKNPRRFIAITDPGSQLEQQAKADGFRAILRGEPTIGGRFSALSNFGIAPAVLSGIDTAALLDGADRMAAACRGDDPAANPGVSLGIVLGEAALQGMDKLTLFASPGVSEIGAWLDQLIAESTGKAGRGIIPIAGEAIRPPEAYGDDRLFVHIRLEGEPDPQAKAIDRLIAAGRPVMTIPVAAKADLGAEFFRWEIATAVAGALLQINPFDQPDVEAAKIAARKLTDEVERTGRLPEEEPFHRERGISAFADQANVTQIMKGVTQRTLSGLLGAHVRRAGAGDYAAILAYVEMNDANLAPLLRMRQRIAEQTKVATTLGFGPRYLHSTGQLHKGGPGSGVFLIITHDEAQDLPVPGRRYSFGTVKAAQARGDFAVLGERGRRALRVHLGKDVKAGLSELAQIV